MAGMQSQQIIMVIQTRHTVQVECVIIKQAIKNAPPIGDPKQLDTPTAQAAASISVFLDSFCKTQTNKQTQSCS